MFQQALAFDTDDPEFVRGFEAGRLWERVRFDHTPWEQTIHASNAEMLIRMCEAEGRTASTIDDFGDTWVSARVS